DEVLAPIVATLDCLDAYFDPWLAPEDFLDWLSAWLGLALDENLSVDRRRLHLSEAAGLYALRGTMAGLRAQLEVLTGIRVELADNGGVATSRTPGGELPGESTPRVAVRVFAESAGAVDTPSLDRIVAAVKPAHVVHTMEVVQR